MPGLGRAHARVGAPPRAALVLSPDAVERVPAMLGVGPRSGRLVAERVRPGGLRSPPDRGRRAGRPVAALAGPGPAGWDGVGEAGSVGYDEDDLEAFRDGPTLVYVGRYTEVKRLPS